MEIWNRYHNSFMRPYYIVTSCIVFLPSLLTFMFFSVNFSLTSNLTYNSIDRRFFLIDFLEGDECKLKDGSLGTCKSFALCRWAIQGLNQRVITYRDLIRCSFEVRNNGFLFCFLNVVIRFNTIQLSRVLMK